MSLVRLAKTGGDGKSLFPRGCETIEDVPYEYVRAIEHAYTILSWHENYMSKEIPPPWMWPFPDELEIWFEEVRLSQDNPSDDTDEESSSVGNEYADRFK